MLVLEHRIASLFRSAGAQMLQRNATTSRPASGQDSRSQRRVADLHPP